MTRATPMRPKPRWLAPAVCPALLVLVAVLSLAEGCGLPARPVQTTDRPNVVLILTDDLDAGLLQRYGERYPNLRELAAEGTPFENAFVTDPLCCPSRATTLRGQYSHNHRIVGNWPPLGGAGKFRDLGREESTGATWLRGVRDGAALGGAGKFRDLGREESTVATWLRGEGYRTTLVGKYMNDYHGDRVPAGWDEWYGIAGGHLDHDLNENGRVRHYDPGRYHLDDVLAGKAADSVRRSPEHGTPFFMWIGTQAPHAPATPAPRHEEAFSPARPAGPPGRHHGAGCRDSRAPPRGAAPPGAPPPASAGSPSRGGLLPGPAAAAAGFQRRGRLGQARLGAGQPPSGAGGDPAHARPLPRSPAVDAGRGRDGRGPGTPRRGRGEIPPMQALYRDRLRSMLAVDEMVGRLMDALEESGELADTYVFFTSDNGWHAGEHRLTTGKWTAYEEDVRVPLIVRGPGGPAGRTLPHPGPHHHPAP